MSYYHGVKVRVLNGMEGFICMELVIDGLLMLREILQDIIW